MLLDFSLKPLTGFTFFRDSREERALFHFMLLDFSLGPVMLLVEIRSSLSRAWRKFA
jgi:hypothetical protein